MSTYLTTHPTPDRSLVPMKPVVKTTKPKVKVDPATRIVNQFLARMMNPAQERAQAAAAVKSQINLGLAGMRQSALAAQQQARHQSARAQQYAEALRSLRDIDALQTNAFYKEAAQDIQGLGTGLTGTIAEAQQAGANDAASRIAAATQGLGQAKGLDVEGLRNIAQYTGVVQPSTDLYEEAASQAAQAKLMRLANAQKIGNIAQDYLREGTEAQQELQRQRNALEATRPALYQQALQAIQSGGRQDMATVFSALALMNTQKETAADIVATKAATKQGGVKTAATVKKTGAQTGKTKAETTKTKAQTTGLLPGGKLAPGYAWSSSDPKTRVPQPYDTDKYMLDPADSTHTRVIPRPVAPSGSSATTAAKNQQKLINTSIDKLSKAAGTATFTRNATPPLMKGIRADRWVPTMTYAQAKIKLLNAHVPAALRRNPRVLAAIDNALAQWGYKVP